MKTIAWRICVILVLGMLLSLSVGAAGIGSIQIQLIHRDKPIEQAEIYLYRVGQAVPGGYLLTEEFGGGLILEADLLSPELAQWLARLGKQGSLGITGEQGEVRFDGLEEGVYLLTQKKAAGGCKPMEPFLITVPWDGYVWEIRAEPILEEEENPETGDPGVIWHLLSMLLSGGTILAMLAFGISGKTGRMPFGKNNI